MEHREKAEEKKNIVAEFPEVKGTIHKLHEEKRAVPHGLRAMEMARLPKEWDDFIEYGADDLHLNEKESGRLLILFKKLLDEDLTADEERELGVFMAQYETSKHPHGEARRQ